MSQINFHQDQALSIEVNGETVDIEHIILATPSSIINKLVSNSASLENTCKQIDQLKYEPVTTVYLQYPQSVQLPIPMMGVVNSKSEWLFDRQYCHQPGLIAVVISADGAHMELSNQDLAKLVSSELQDLFPHWPKATSSNVIREKRACFRCTTDIDKNRPGIATAIKNLTLCGDYVYFEENNAAGLPSTLEGSMRSGVKCAQKFIQEHI